MVLFDYLKTWILWMIIGRLSAAVSYNQPTFCPTASWNLTAITFANNYTIGAYPLGIFITRNNTVYAPSAQYGNIIVWSEGSSAPTRNITGNLVYPDSVFVTTSNDIYVDNGYPGNRIYKFTLNSNNGSSLVTICQKCYGIFVDISNKLYCSIETLHQVVTTPLNSSSNVLTIVAGAGLPGSASNMLCYPQGIFVDINFDLYVADSVNNRIQRFRSGQINGITVAGSGSITPTISLNGPNGVTLDGNGYIFIVDGGNHRIVGSGPNGFQCIAGCFGNGSASNQLNYPHSMSFDSYGNIFVVDWGNNRIQQFFFLTDSCNSLTTATEQSVTSIMNTIQNLTTNNTIINSSNSISYNRPILNAYATWSANAITFADNNTIGQNPYGIFVNLNNSVYVTNQQNNEILIWLNNNINLTETLFGSLSSPNGIFVTINGDIYVDNGFSNGQVDKMTMNGNASGDVVMYVGSSCYGIFIDINNNLYCSMSNLHQVVTTSLNSVSNVLQIVAGTGCVGSSSKALNTPRGIFVNTNLDLYVADCNNSRIQLFHSGQINATTILGTGSSNNAITLSYPTGVVLDGNNYLFVVDSGNHRIIGSGPSGFRCIVGCYGNGSQSNELYYPQSMAFDSFGNIFITDTDNSRIQKFILLNNTFAISYNQPIFCPDASWNPDAITLANSSILAASPSGVFVTTNDTIYVIDRANNRVLVWPNENNNSTGNITFPSLVSPYSIFVTINGDIYIDNGIANGQVDKLGFNSSTGVLVMIVSLECTGLFIDISETLYCSMQSDHSVIKRWLRMRRIIIFRISIIYNRCI